MPSNWGYEPDMRDEEPCRASAKLLNNMIRKIVTEMLDIICADDSTEDDRDMAEAALVDAVAPDLLADAARWAFVRACLSQMHNPKMNGEHSYRFRPLRSTGSTVDIAVDKAMGLHGGGS